MDANELKNIWQAYDAKLEKSLKMNEHCIEAIQIQKAKRQFKSLLIGRIVELAIAVALLLFMGSLLYSNIDNIGISVSAGIIMVFAIISISGCIRQIRIITQINYSESVTEIQSKLALLQTNMVRYLRLAFLILPFYTAYIVVGFKLIFDVDIVAKGNVNWWIGQIVVSVLFIPLSIWLLKKLSFENMHLKLIRVLIEGAGGKSVVKAMSFIKEIDEFKKG